MARPNGFSLKSHSRKIRYCEAFAEKGLDIFLPALFLIILLGASHLPVTRRGFDRNMGESMGTDQTTTEPH